LQELWISKLASLKPTEDETVAPEEVTEEEEGEIVIAESEASKSHSKKNSFLMKLKVPLEILRKNFI
jgi:hypothetical protein